MAATTNVRQVSASIATGGDGLERALCDELAVLAQQAAVLMRNKAPKWRSSLVDSIRAEPVSAFEWHVRTGVDYAQAVEEGRGPGKGLPRWSDPDAADIKAWLTAKAFAGRRRSRSTSGALREVDELRDRYQGLAWHVRHHGIKPHPYAGPTADMMQRIFPGRLAQAGREYLARQGGGSVA